MNYPCFGFTWVGPLPHGSTIHLPGERHGDELYARPAHLTPAVQHSELLLNSRLYRAQERILRYDPTYVTVVGDGKTKDPVLDAALCTAGSASAPRLGGPNVPSWGICSGLPRPKNGSIHMPGIVSLSYGLSGCAGPLFRELRSILRGTGPRHTLQWDSVRQFKICRD